MKISQVLVPNRAKISWIPTGAVGRKEGDSRSMFAFEPDVGPPAKPRGISTMSSLVGREIVPNDEASATRKIPGGLRFVGVMEEV